jgi:hypothetical protein
MRSRTEARFEAKVAGVAFTGRGRVVPGGENGKRKEGGGRGGRHVLTARDRARTGGGRQRGCGRGSPGSGADCSIHESFEPDL